MSLLPEEVVPALHACDVGFVLREDNWTNRVAFPNKFAEYCAAGLLIVTSPGLRAAADVVVTKGIGVLVDPREIEPAALSQYPELREKISTRASNWSGYYDACRSLVNERYSMEKALRPVVDFFLDG
ncbi:glycosyltransferase family 4 protein [Symbiobacterium thermophilum]|nr:glycosyltransferase family 4 protein [Symbiobacterium thermophilum]